MCLTAPPSLPSSLSPFLPPPSLPFFPSPTPHPPYQTIDDNLRKLQDEAKQLCEPLTIPGSSEVLDNPYQQARHTPIPTTCSHVHFHVDPFPFEANHVKLCICRSLLRWWRWSLEASPTSMKW